MVAAVLRLVALIALVLMPIGMGSTPAIAGPAGGAHAMAMGHDMVSMDMSHCSKPESPGSGQEPVSKPMDCTAACAAIPAPVMPSLAKPIKPAAPQTVFLAVPFSSRAQEIATPPPKLA